FSETALSLPACSKNTWSIEGTKCSVVIPCSLMRNLRYELSRCPSGFATTSRAPVNSGQKNSQTETSKLNGVFCSTQSCFVSRYCSCIQKRRLQMPRCVICTPFGRPVEPEV